MEERLNFPGRIVLHCSDTEDGDGADYLSIRKYHVEVNKWDDIGYHFVLERFRNSFRVMPGRLPKFVGAHAKFHNHDSIGVCVVGKYEVKLNEAIFEDVCEFLTKLCFFYGIPPAGIVGHRELDPKKSCPGMAWDMDRVRRSVAVRLDIARREGLDI